MSEIKLLPCPFCGGEAIQEAGERIVCYDEYEYFECVHCTNCKASVEGETVEEAVNKWNTRKPMERILDELVNLKKCYLGEEDAVMKSMSFADYIQEIIDKAGGIE